MDLGVIRVEHLDRAGKREPCFKIKTPVYRFAILRHIPLQAGSRHNLLLSYQISDEMRRLDIDADEKASKGERKDQS